MIALTGMVIPVARLNRPAARRASAIALRVYGCLKPPTYIPTPANHTSIPGLYFVLIVNTPAVLITM